MPTINELHMMQAAPLEIKIKMTKQRIREWVNHFGLDGVYVSFSGGKDSTVLLTIAREMYPDIKAVFIDTGLEFPEIREFVKTWDNVDWVKPKLTFKQTVEKYGYPFISKEVSECVYGARRYLTRVMAQMDNLADRQTDRQTDRPPYAQFYRKLNGIGEYESKPYTKPIADNSDGVSRELLEKAVNSCKIGGAGQREILQTLWESAPRTARSIQNCGSTIDILSMQNASGGGKTQNIENSVELENLTPEEIQRLSLLVDNTRVQRLLGILRRSNKATLESIPNKAKDRSKYSCKRYQFFLDADFEIGNQCCTVMKKEPAKRYHKETGRVPILAMQASESRLRTQGWLKTGCNAFDSGKQASNPMAFWTEQDVLLYIYLNKTPIASVYGEIVPESEVDGQMSLSDLGIFDLGRPTLKVTGYPRTG